MQVVTQIKIEEYPLLSRGKVRDIYEIDAERLLIVTTDRMSAFDVIMREPVPYKGVVLNQITLFWMQRFEHIIKHHLITHDFEQFPQELKKYAPLLSGRSVIVHRAKPLPVECIVRGYLAGSGWAEYKKYGTVCRQKLPEGLLESSRLEQPLFTPSTKAEAGEHDENISDAKAIELLGETNFNKVKEVSLKLFSNARDYAAERGIIIADTKFEFGLLGGDIILIDEALTPDSSRFWPSASYTPGKSQPSFDKQYLRDWLETQPWDKTPPPPVVPKDIIVETADRYMEAYKILTGKKLALS